jgi:PAS domain S-box-containing protein
MQWAKWLALCPSSVRALRDYFELASQPLVAIDHQGIIRAVHPRAAEMFGYANEELVGQSMSLLLPERYRGTHASHLMRYFAAPHERAMGMGMDLAGRRKDGSEFPVEIGLRSVATHEGTVAVALVIDITQRKQLESELARVNAELRRSNSELEQFAYVASHDLQEPLRMISGHLQLLERRYRDKLDADAMEFIHYAVEGAVRMKHLILDLLRLSRAGTQAVNIRSVDPAAVIEAACANLENAIENKDVQISYGAMPLIAADAGLLTQVFQNLIANALKFRGSKGPPKIQIGAARESGQWLFSVKDNGIGIDPRHSERIFRMFERLHTPDEYAGSGVGLAICKRIIERHGGRIWVESEPGLGCTFFFTLPALAEDASAKSASGG